MCIFNGNVIRVANTQILVLPLPGGRQLTVYSNTVETDSPNAMILPVPKGEVPVVPCDTSKYTEVFRDCEALFPREREDYAFGSFGAGFGGSAKSASLPVQRVGGYDVSIVHELEDFARLSAAHFVVPANIQQILTQNYGVGFSFVVCRFDKKVQAHPIAYVSNRLPSGRLFIPTRHAHGTPETPNAGVAMHQGVWCDICRTSPIVGTRWKCAHCADFDLCDTCYTNQRQQHPVEHLFYHMPAPVVASKKDPIMRPRGYDGRNPIVALGLGDSVGFRFVSNVVDEWDHTIYVANGQFTCAPSCYDSCKTITAPPNMQTSQINVSLSGILGFNLGPESGIKHLTKVTISGRGYGNRDYEAAVYDQ